MSFLEISRVGKAFPTRDRKSEGEMWAIKDTTLTIEQGEFWAIIGPSGCGKSTLLRIVDGLIKASEGDVTLKGKPITGPGPDRGVVFQHSNLLPWRTAQKNVEYGLECIGVSSAERAKKATTYLDMVGLKGFGDYYPAQLSGGMQQRVGLARAYAIEPEILLLDEPFGALDAQTRLTLQGDLERIWERKQATSILVTHDMEEAVFLADKVAVMTTNPGRIIDVIDVPFGRPRNDSLRDDPEFARLRSRVWQALKDGTPKRATEPQS